MPTNPAPIEYVVSEMILEDEHESYAKGVIVSPRYEGDEDSKFEGEQNALTITIHSTSSHAEDAYQAAMNYFEDLRNKEILKEHMLRSMKKKRRKRT